MTIDSIPKFILTLPESPHRAESAASHFAQAGVGPITFVHGINGKAFGLKTIFPYTLDDDRDRPNERGTFFIGHHETGIFLSHYQMWFAASLLPHSHVMICEDDAQFLPNWKPRVTQALEDCPPDFDWLFVGSCGAMGGNKRRMKGDVWEVRFPACLHCYIVAKKALPVLLATQRKVWAPLDVSLFVEDPRGASKSSFDKLKVYTILPRAVAQWNTNIPE